MKVLFHVFCVKSLHSRQKKKNPPKNQNQTKKVKKKKNESSKQITAKPDIYLRFLQHESLCVFNQSVRTALNKCERLKSSAATIYPSGLRRKSLKYVCWQTSNNCRVYAVICHHHPLPFLFFLLFPLMVLKAFTIFFFFLLIDSHQLLFILKQE